MSLAGIELAQREWLWLHGEQAMPNQNLFSEQDAPKHQSITLCLSGRLKNAAEEKQR